MARMHSLLAAFGSVCVAGLTLAAGSPPLPTVNISATTANVREGRTNSAAFIEQIGYPATRDYVRAVMQRSRRYRS